MRHKVSSVLAKAYSETPTSAKLSRPARSVKTSTFATAAQLELLNALGWRGAAVLRGASDTHASLKCCFEIHDGSEAIAAFGYTAMTLPLASGCPQLRRAKSRVVRVLDRVSYNRGLLIQNRPLVAFSGRDKARVAVFGGWYLKRRQWSPFLFGPDGLSGLDRQQALFSSATSPTHMADIYGHDTAQAMPQIARLMRNVAMLGTDIGVSKLGKRLPAPHCRDAMLVSVGSGWFQVRHSVRDVVSAKLLSDGNVPAFQRSRYSKVQVAAPARAHFAPSLPKIDQVSMQNPQKFETDDEQYWSVGSDEFRFRNIPKQIDDEAG